MKKKNTDGKSFPFRPKARIMRTLGEELISSNTVAAIELVKNAYDADAKNVLIRFTGPLEPGKGFIEVIDNGHGMSLDVVRSAWMEPATYSKIEHIRSEKLNRRVLGSKGIGRFASSRLATELELITRRKLSDSEVFGVFDWTQFDDENKYLDDIMILTEERKPEEICPGGAIESLYTKKDKSTKKALNQGTILRMNGLKQIWTDNHFVDLQRGLSRLVSPFSKLSDFCIDLELPDKFEKFSMEISPPKIIKYPHYKVTGQVGVDGSFDLHFRIYSTGVQFSKKGRFYRRIKTSNGGTTETKTSEIMIMDDKRRRHTIGGTESSSGESDMLPPECGSFDIELRIFDRDELGNVMQKVGTTIRNIRKDLDAIAGINIFRDGFRVLPYGEPKNDWLRLDLRRVQNPTLRLSNNQIVGYLSITADGSPELRDQSNREGLNENQALQDLRDILILLLSEIEAMRFDSRPRRKDKQSDTPIGSLFAALDLEPLRQDLAAKYPNDLEIQQLIDNTMHELTNRIEQIQIVLGRYHSLATLGQLIDVVLHDGRNPVGKIVTQSTLGKENIDEAEGDKSALLSQLRKRFVLVKNQGNILSTLFRRIEPFGGRKRGKPVQLYLEEIVRVAFSVFETEINKLRVRVVLPRTETLVRVDEAEMQEVVVNLLQNSLYWLQHVDRGARQISVSVKRMATDHVEVIFADSGPGISPQDRSSIFEPYFSKKPDGVGLGLAIAGEIVNDYYGGRLELMDSGPLEGAVFRISLKKRV